VCGEDGMGIGNEIYSLLPPAHSTVLHPKERERIPERLAVCHGEFKFLQPPHLAFL
jgi:hypothetical protein